MGPVLAGYAPIGDDPELMYQPIKTELVRALSAGRLPFWSDRFGLGMPLVAESHVAAFYPPNWVFYRLWEVGTAYRLTMWLHSVAIVAATFAYARVLGITRAGAALAAITFALCGFQAIHAVHEPFYHVMPYLPLCLLLADRYATTSRLAWLAGLALAWGAQITLGHFQIQMWTAGLVLAAGTWRTVTSAGPTRRLWRLVGLSVGLGWGAAIAWVQLRLTWELTGVAGFARPPQFLANYLFPPAHWSQLALPEVFLGRPRGAGDAYWGDHGTTPGEASAYVGVVPLILAFVGLVAAPRDRALTPWRIIVPLTMALATMSGWWPDGFFFLLQLPGLGWFRAPARYTLLTSLGLALLAGRGLDQAIAPRRFRRGLVLAVLFGAVAWGWSIDQARGADFQLGLGAETLPIRFAAAGLAWVLGLAAVAGWRLGRWGIAVPMGLTALELTGLFFVGPVWWDWTVRLSEASTVIRRLATEPGVGRVACALLNVPVYAGQTTAYPTLGITPPPPNYLLEAATKQPGELDTTESRWLRRFGVTHGIWAAGKNVVGTQVLAEIADPVLDRMVAGISNLRGHGPWKLVSYPAPFPAAWVARRVHTAKVWGVLYTELEAADLPDEAWFLPEDRPADLPDLGDGTAAGTIRVQSWDGRTAVVEHEGPCILILQRTHYPGWTYRVEDGPERPVLKLNGGLQGALLTGAGTHRVETRYRPTGLTSSARVTLTALAAAALVLGASGLRTCLGNRSKP
jgi:hypothetical protein